MSNKIIRKGLATFIAGAIQRYQDSGREMHIASVSALFNNATSGDVTLLNRIYEGLRSNDQAALKLYIRRASILNGLVMSNAPVQVDTLDTDTMVEMLELGSVVTFSKNVFTTIKNPDTDAAKSMAKLCADRFINPLEENGDKMVFERNNFAEHKTLGDADVIKAILKQVNEAVGNSSDKKTYALSEGIKTQLGKIKTMLDVNLKQVNLGKE